MQQSGAIIRAFRTAEREETGERYVPTREIKDAVSGHEARILGALNIGWSGKVTHITCPFPKHGGKSDWRWDKTEKRAFCTCGVFSIFDCVIECKGVDFDAAKLFVADTIGRADLIRVQRAEHDRGNEGDAKAKVRRIQRTDAASLLSPPNDNQDDNLVGRYLAHRLGLIDTPVSILPTTPYVGIKSLGYFDPPPSETGKPVKVGEWPCAVFGMVDRDGQTHAQRIYLAPDGAGKAELGLNAAGHPRDAKKSARVKEGDNISGRVAVWGAIETATVVLLSEGIETAAALAYAFSKEVVDGSFAVAAGVTAGGLEAFRPWDANAEVIVCADRDEAVKREGKLPSRRGEKAARKFGSVWHKQVVVKIAMPGESGQSVDWLDVLREHGALRVRLGILDAPIFELTEEERGPLVTMPPGFRFGKYGLMRSNGDEDDQWISAPFDVIAQSCSGDGTNWGLLLAWRDPDGRPHRLPIPNMAIAGDGAEVRRVLMDRGLSISPNMKARNSFNSFLASVRVTTRMKAVQQVGWHDGAFVLPDISFGGDHREEVTLQTQTVLEHAYREAGTIEDWQREVGRFATGNSRLMLALSAAFCAPLMRPCDMEGGGFHFKGPSSIGKTTLLNVAGSVWGGGPGGYLRSWRGTSNGTEGVAQCFNDGLLTLDEISQVQPRDAGEVVYMLSNGAGKSRSARDGSARKVSRWRVTYLSSGEKGLADILAEDRSGRRMAAGQEVRFIDLPADASKGLGLFENLHGFADAGKLAQHLNAAAVQFYGTPSRVFLAAIVEDIGAIKGAANEYMAAFIASVVPPGADGQVERVARRFALVAAGGAIAAHQGVAPWKPAEAVEAAKECFAAWLKDRGGIDAAENRNAIAQVRSFLHANGMARFVPAWPSDDDGSERSLARDIRDIAGYRKRTPDRQSWDFFATSSGWKEMCSGLDPRRAAAVLADRGFLERPKTGDHLSAPVTVPGMGKLRLYHITSSILEGGEND